MSHPHYLNNDLPAYILARRQWIADMEAQHRSDEQASMAMLAYFLVLGIVCTFCLVAWVLW